MAIGRFRVWCALAGSSCYKIPAAPVVFMNCRLEIPTLPHPVREVTVDQFPFLIGRSLQHGNHLVLEDLRISRRAAAIVEIDQQVWVEDLGQANGLYVNGEQVQKRRLKGKDRIRFGQEDACTLVFHSAPQQTATFAPARIQDLLGSLSGTQSTDLHGLHILLEAASLLQSGLPLDSVLAAILNHALGVTNADRGMFLERGEDDAMQVRFGQDKSGEPLPQDAMNPSHTVIRQAVAQRSIVINEDILLAERKVQTAQSVMIQMLRSVFVLPLYARGSEGTDEELLGVLYLDSKRTAAFSALEKQILEALGAQATAILENARLLQRERERQRLEQELSIAREIQQGLVPHGILEFPNLTITGIHMPCHEVGGDYFDIFPLEDGRIALLVCDVAGKGLGAALLTTMLQGAMSGLTLDADPLRVVQHLNKFLCNHANVGRYATIFLGMLDTSGLLEFVSAGHPSPLLIHGEQVSEIFSGGSFPIGLIPEASYDAKKIQLQEGDTLVLFSDGVTESENTSGKLFEIGGLATALTGKANLALTDLQTEILADIRRFAAGAKHSDDVTLVLVRYQPQVSSVT